MGVFPLADTMNLFSNPLSSGSGTPCTPVDGWSDNGWTGEVWRSHLSTTPRRISAPVHSPFRSVAGTTDHMPSPGAPPARLASSEPGGTSGEPQPFVRLMVRSARSPSAGRRLPPPVCRRISGMHAALEPSCRSRSPRVRNRWHPNAVEQ